MDRFTVTTGQLARDIQYEQHTMITAQVNYPILEGCDLAGAKRINRCYRNAADNIMTAASGGLLREAISAYELAPAHFTPYEVTADFTVTYNSYQLISMYTDVFLYAGGSHGITYRYGSTWQLSSGHPLFLSSLFPPTTIIGKTVSEFVAKAAQTMAPLSSEGESHLLADARQHYTPENFYLCDQGLCIFYQQYALGPYTMGIPVFTIPYSADGPYSPEKLTEENDRT